MVGNGIDKLFERALPEGEKSKENVLRVRKEFVPYYDIHNADDSRPYPGIPELLSYLQDAGIQIAVASNKYQAATQKLIDHYFPEIHFTAARVTACGVTWGFRPRAELEEFSPQYIVDTAEEVKRLIL